MIGLVRVAVGALGLLVYMAIGMGTAWWIAVVFALAATAGLAAVQGRSENARWAGLAVALLVIAATQIREHQLRTARLVLALLAWIVCAQIMQWLIVEPSAHDDAPHTMRRRRGSRK